MQTPPPNLPAGHVPCPRCGNAVLPGAPLCPNCGAAFGVAAPRRRNTGVIVLLVGLLLTMLGGGVFFVGCIAAMSNSGRSGATNGMELLLQICMGTAALGVVMMFVGLISTIVQAVRR